LIRKAALLAYFHSDSPATNQVADVQLHQPEGFDVAG
jgi:hypothetical protein